MLPTTPLPTAPGWARDPWGDFAPQPTPGPYDWLATHLEFGQTFAEYVLSRPNRPDGVRSTLVLQPLGRFAGTGGPDPELLRRFAAAFFGLEVQVLPAVDLRLVDITSRQVPGQRGRQLRTGDLLRLLRANLPEHAYCMVGITMADLYPGPQWNYVFGEASLSDRVAVYSFARYLPAFWGDERDDPRLVLERSCKVLAHETGHAFGLRHCTAALCVMNGSNHLQESDSRPLHLCPEDLRKLQWAVGFDVRERYRRLAAVDHELGLTKEAHWVERRLAHLGDE